MEILGEVQHVDWTKLIAHNVPKFVFISWLLMNRGLATCAYLQKIGVRVNHQCCFCGEEEESLEHLFFECEYSGEVWEQLTGWSKIHRRRQGWSLERQYLFLQCKTNSGKQLMYRSVFVVVVYLLWKARNMKRMQGVQTSVEEVVRKGKVVMAICSLKNKKLARLLD